jgi:hypothetical protein
LVYINMANMRFGEATMAVWSNTIGSLVEVRSRLRSLLPLWSRMR